MQLDGEVLPKLQQLKNEIHIQRSGSWVDRWQARSLAKRVEKYEQRFAMRRRQVEDKARQHTVGLNRFLDPVERERQLKDAIHQTLARAKEVIASKEFAGAVAETELIDELNKLGPYCLVLNDLKLTAHRFIQYEGEPLRTAQIDTLVLTPAGAFVIEVKNWSAQFARSGAGLDPIKQVGRASYLVYDRLRSAGLNVKVRSIVATNGQLPPGTADKVAVRRISQVRGYIQWFKSAGADVQAMRQGMGI